MSIWLCDGAHLSLGDNILNGSDNIIYSVLINSSQGKFLNSFFYYGISTKKEKDVGEAHIFLFSFVF